MMSKVQLGLDAVLYRGTAGTTGATEVKNVKNLTLSVETGSADITTRATDGWKAYAATLKDGSLEWDMVDISGDADIAAVRAAWLAGTALALFADDGTGEGLDADFVITKFDRDEQLEEAITYKVTAKPTYLTRAPAWKTAGGTTGAVKGARLGVELQYSTDCKEWHAEMAANDVYVRISSDGKTWSSPVVIVKPEPEAKALVKAEPAAAHNGSAGK